MTVDRLSLGTAQLGMPYGIASSGRALTRGEVTSILQTAIDLGVSALDTAPDYGHAEQRIGAFINEHGLDGEVRITTKLPALGAVDETRLEHIVEERLTKSLRALGTEFVDVYLVHDIGDLRRFGSRLVDALLRQQDNGRVLELGVSIYDPEELEVLDEFPALTVVQHPCNLLDRRLLSGNWLARLRRNGTKLQIRSILLQGLLAMPPDDLPASMADAREAVQALRALLATFDLTLPEAAVAFAASIEVDRVIVAANSSTQLEELLAAIDTALPDDLGRSLERAFGALARSVYDPRTWT